MAGSALSVTEFDCDGRHVLLLAGELDLASVPVLEATIVRVRADRRHGVTLDLSGLTFLDVSGLHVIVYADQLYKKLGYGFSLTRGPRAIQRLFEVTGLIDVLPFLESDLDAEQSS